MVQDREILHSAATRMKEALIRASRMLPDDAHRLISEAVPAGGKAAAVMDAIRKNLEIARERSIPMCQDTGAFWCLVSIGRESGADIVSIEGIEHLTNLQKATHAFDGCTSLKYVPDLRFTINNEEADPADFSYMFLNCDALENINAIAFTGDGYFNATQMFGPIAPLKALKKLELSAYPVNNGVYFMFGIHGSDIETIDSIVLREGHADYYGLFWSLPNLQTATFTGKCMPYMICMHTQEKLSVDSFQSLFEALLPVDDGRGIRLGDYNKSRIPDEIKQIALDKGYQLDTFNAE